MSHSLSGVYHPPIGFNQEHQIVTINQGFRDLAERVNEFVDSYTYFRVSESPEQIIEKCERVKYESLNAFNRLIARIHIDPPEEGTYSLINEFYQSFERIRSLQWDLGCIEEVFTFDERIKEMVFRALNPVPFVHAAQPAPQDPDVLNDVVDGFIGGEFYNRETAPLTLPEAPQMIEPLLQPPPENPPRKRVRYRNDAPSASEESRRKRHRSHKDSVQKLTESSSSVQPRDERRIASLPESQPLASNEARRARHQTLSAQKATLESAPSEPEARRERTQTRHAQKDSALKPTIEHSPSEREARYERRAAFLTHSSLPESQPLASDEARRARHQKAKPKNRTVSSRTENTAASALLAFSGQVSKQKSNQATALSTNRAASALLSLVKSPLPVRQEASVVQEKNSTQLSDTAASTLLSLVKSTLPVTEEASQVQGRNSPQPVAPEEDRAEIAQMEITEDMPEPPSLRLEERTTALSTNTTDSALLSLVKSTLSVTEEALQIQGRNSPQPTVMEIVEDMPEPPSLRLEERTLNSELVVPSVDRPILPAPAVNQVTVEPRASVETVMEEPQAVLEEPPFVEPVFGKPLAILAPDKKSVLWELKECIDMINKKRLDQVEEQFPNVFKSLKTNGLSKQAARLIKDREIFQSLMIIQETYEKIRGTNPPFFELFPEIGKAYQDNKRLLDTFPRAAIPTKAYKESNLRFDFTPDPQLEVILSSRDRIIEKFELLSKGVEREIERIKGQKVNITNFKSKIVKYFGALQQIDQSPHIVERMQEPEVFKSLVTVFNRYEEIAQLICDRGRKIPSEIATPFIVSFPNIGNALKAKAIESHRKMPLPKKAVKKKKPASDSPVTFSRDELKVLADKFKETLIKLRNSKAHFTIFTRKFFANEITRLKTFDISTADPEAMETLFQIRDYYEEFRGIAFAKILTTKRDMEIPDLFNQSFFDLFPLVEAAYKKPKT